MLGARIFLKLEITMSHVATVDVHITSLDELGKACKRLGLELVQGQQTYRWFGSSVGDYPLPAGFEVSDLGKCEHAIRIPGDVRAYEIGVVKRRDGKAGYCLHWDFWAGGKGMEAVAGANCGKLKQAYAVEAAMSKARQQGFNVMERKLNNGQVQLICSKG